MLLCSGMAFGQLTYSVGWWGAAVTGYNGTPPSHLVIPATHTVEEVVYPVTRIEAYAFSGKRSLESVSIPDGVVKIGLSAITQSAPPDNHLLVFKVHHFRM
jgi:hypothetical protein